MEETYNLKAVVLKREPWREADLLVTLYSGEQGRIELAARGARKIKSKLAAHLEPWNLVEVMAVRGRRLDYAGAATSENCFSGLKSDYEKLEIAGKTLAFFDRLIKPRESEGAAEIFFLLKDFLKLINDHDRPTGELKLLADFFIFKLLIQAGYQPELFNCLVCGKRIAAGGNFFSPAKGGVICRQCLKEEKISSLTISDEAVKVLRLAGKMEIKRLAKLALAPKTIKEINNLICSFQKHCLNQT